MNYKIEFTNQFKREAKLCRKKNYDISLLEEVMLLLRNKGELPKKYKAHILSGDYEGYWECHISPDWLLVYKITTTHVYFARTGTHSDLF